MATRVVETLETRFTANHRSLDSGFQYVERRTGQHLQKVENLYRNAQGRLVSSANAMQTSWGGSGGWLPGLGNISEIIQALPTVGRLAGALVRPLTDATQEGIRFNMMIESAEAGFVGVAGSVENARKHVEALRKFGEDSPLFETEGLVRTSRLMNVFGFQLSEHIPKVKIWGDAIAAGGEMSEETLLGVARAFGQMRTLSRVNSEEMSQLAERGIPSWELLAKAIGKTVAETRKLVEQGRLSGPAAVEAMTAMIEQDPRFSGTAARQANTLQGRLSRLDEIRTRAQGLATENLTADISDSLAGALTNEDLAINMAKGFNTAIAPVSGLIKTGIVQTVEGGLTAGFQEALNASMAVLPADVTRFFDGGIWKPLLKAAGIESPSTKTRYVGEMLAAGLWQGFQSGMQQGEVNIREAIKRVEEQFKKITGKRLPVVVGQTEFHTAQGFDHTQGADIALNPNTREGRLAMQLLAAEGVPVLAQQGARRSRSGRVTSTGPHIHAGRLSPNLNTSDAFVVSEHQGALSAPQSGFSRGGFSDAVPVRIVGPPDFSGFPGTPYTVGMAAGQRGSNEPSEFPNSTGRFAGPGNQRAFMEWLYNYQKGFEGGRVTPLEQSDYNQSVALMARQLEVSSSFVHLAQEHVAKLLEANRRLVASNLGPGRDMGLAADPSYVPKRLADLGISSLTPPNIPTHLTDFTQEATQAQFNLLKTMGQLGPEAEAAFGQAGDAANGFYDKLKDGPGMWLSRVETTTNKARDIFGITAKDAGQVFQDSFVGAFTQVELGFKGMVSSFVLTFAQGLAQMAQQWAAAQIAKHVGGFLQGLFGGGASVGGLGSAAGSLIPGFASGTLSAPSGLAVTGEQGAELVDFRGGERVYSHNETKQLLNNTSRRTINLTVNFVGQSSTPYARQQQSQVARNLLDLLNHEMERGG